MTAPFPFESMILFGFLGIMLLCGIVLRARVSLFQYFLIPSCIIGGLLGLTLLNTGVINFRVTDMESFAYHFFNISFISLGLTPRVNGGNSAAADKSIMKGPLWMALVSGVTMSLQAVIGGSLLIFFNAIGYDLFPTFGFFSPLGFTQGPGPALSIGKTWESFGFTNAATIGMTFATIGFMFAFFVGVPLVNMGIRRGYSAREYEKVPDSFLKGIIQKDKKNEPAGTLTMHSGNIDTMAFQAALVGLVYVLAYLLVKSIGRVLPPDIAKSLWGFFFFFGLVISLFMRYLMSKAGIEYMIDPGIQRRITGWSVDFLIVSTVMAVQAVIVWKYIIPIAAMTLTSGILTTIVVVFLGSKLWSYNLERTAASYGIATGTASSGLLLLRIADPDFKTPVALELGIQAIFAAPIVLGYMILLNAPVWWNWSILLTVLIFLFCMIFFLVLLRVFKLWGMRGFKAC